MSKRQLTVVIAAVIASANVACAGDSETDNTSGSIGDEPNAVGGTATEASGAGAGETSAAATGEGSDPSNRSPGDTGTNAAGQTTSSDSTNGTPPSNPETATSGEPPNTGASVGPAASNGAGPTTPARDTVLDVDGVSGEMGDSAMDMGSPAVETEQPDVADDDSSSDTETPATDTGQASDGSTEATTGEDGIAPDDSAEAEGNGPAESAGCGSAMTPMPCDSSGSPCAMDVDGTARAYYVVLPDDYDATRAYPVVFQFHPLGGNAEQGMNMYNVRPNFPDAIYATPDGLTSGQFQGFSNTGGEDEALTRAIMADIEQKYCVDTSRYFSTGFSFGGSMSYTAACNMSDVFRAVAGMAGAPISGANCASQQPERRVAWWGSHGTEDTALPIDMALPIRDAFIERNGCSEMTVPVDPSPCVAYQGCDEGYPVVWCQVEGQGHAIPDYGPTAIADFFQQF